MQNSPHTTHFSALTSLGGPEHPEAILEPGELPRENERQRNVKPRLQNALNALEALQSKDVQQSGSDLRALLQSLQQQCQRHLGQSGEAAGSSQSSASAQPGNQNQAPPPGQAAGGPSPASAPHPSLVPHTSAPASPELAPASPAISSPGSPSISLAQIAREHDAHGRFCQADQVDALIIRLAQQMQNLADQGIQGVSTIGSGIADVAKGAWGVGEALDPVNWVAATGEDAVSGVHHWFDGQVDDAVEKRLRAMGLDPNQPHFVARPAPTGTPAASSPTTPTATPPAATAPQAGSSAGVPATLITAPATGNVADPKNADLITQYLGWAFDAISRKRLPSATVRADLAAHLAQSRQSPAFTQMVLLQFDSQIGNQQAVRRQDLELAAGR